MMKRCCAIAALALAAGCAGPDRESANAASGTGRAAGAGTAQQPATPRAPEAPASTAGWRVSPTGIGSVRVEMTIPQAVRQLGTELRIPPATGRCAVLQPVPGLDSVSFMTIDGRIARVDVIGGRTTTIEGARVGDTEARIKELYTGRVEEQPHKYTNGHYLVVRPMERTDSAYRIVFETDGSRVTRYRSGRLPEVGWVEGCA